jgi:hypothetical protein
MKFLSLPGIQKPPDYCVGMYILELLFANPAAPVEWISYPVRALDPYFLVTKNLCPKTKSGTFFSIEQNIPIPD